MSGVKLDRLTGDIIIGELKLGRKLKEKDLVRSRSGGIVKQIRRSGSRNYYEAWQQINPKFEIGVALAFIPDGRLQQIRAKFPKAGLRSLEWSRALEDEAKIFHD